MEHDLKKGALRCAIVEQGIIKEYTKARRRSFFDHDESLLLDLYRLYGEEVVSCCRSLNSARIKRAMRIKRKMLGYVLSGHCYFITLTFRDDVLESTCESTRRIYVARYLKGNYLAYVANIDYGDKGKNPQSNEREHYHAVAILPDGKRPPSKWSYGFIKVKRVGKSDLSATKTAKYTAKLSNHALKVNGGYAPRLIYSRNVS